MTTPVPARCEPPKPALFDRIPDEIIRENGFDPAWIAEDYDPENGPYAPIRVFGSTCGCCGGSTAAWTVLSLQTGVGISTDWTHDDGEIDAQDHAASLNAAWREGRNTIALDNGPNLERIK